MQYSVSHVVNTVVLLSPKWPQKLSQSIYFLKPSWGSMHPDTPSLSNHVHAYIHIRHPCNPPCENPGYGPGYDYVKSRLKFAVALCSAYSGNCTYKATTSSAVVIAAILACLCTTHLQVVSGNWNTHVLHFSIFQQLHQPHAFYLDSEHSHETGACGEYWILCDKFWFPGLTIELPAVT